MKINPWTTIATWHKLRADNVLVYKVNKQDLTDIDGILSQADYLSPLEVKRAKQYKYKKDHDTYLLARCALRQITAQHLHINPQDLSLHFGEYGKPYSPDYPKYHFNLSHSGDMILIGIASSPLGVDVEYCNDTIDYLSIANSVFSKEEISSLTSRKMGPPRMSQLAGIQCRDGGAVSGCVECRGRCGRGGVGGDGCYALLTLPMLYSLLLDASYNPLKDHPGL